jgi:hypothetical protein
MWKELIFLSIPSICIYYSISNPSAQGRYLYAEKFGDAGHYLDLYFSSHPRGPLSHVAGGTRFHFEGRLVSDRGEEPVRGVRYVRDGVATYEFASAQGLFRGILGKPATGCEPRMSYTVTRTNGEQLEKGALHAGFCQN